MLPDETNLPNADEQLAANPVAALDLLRKFLAQQYRPAEPEPTTVRPKDRNPDYYPLSPSVQHALYDQFERTSCGRSVGRRPTLDQYDQRRDSVISSRFHFGIYVREDL